MQSRGPSGEALRWGGVKAVTEAAGVCLLHLTLSLTSALAEVLTRVVPSAWLLLPIPTPLALSRPVDLCSNIPSSEMSCLK